MIVGVGDGTRVVVLCMDGLGGQVLRNTETEETINYVFGVGVVSLFLERSPWVIYSVQEKLYSNPVESPKQNSLLLLI